jgi:hypothetical protein
MSADLEQRVRILDIASQEHERDSARLKTRIAELGEEIQQIQERLVELERMIRGN